MTSHVYEVIPGESCPSASPGVSARGGVTHILIYIYTHRYKHKHMYTYIEIMYTYLMPPHVYEHTSGGAPHIHI